MDWLLDLVGIRYKDDGRMPDKGLDCYGLALWVARQRGVNLIETPLESRDYLRVLPRNYEIGWKPYGKILKRNSIIQRYDILCFANRNIEGLVDHLGVAINDNDFIHAAKAFKTVVCDRIKKHRSTLEAVWRFEVTG